MTATDWSRVQKVLGTSLKAGQIIVLATGVKKTIQSIHPAKKARYQVIFFADGTTGGGHNQNVYEVLS